MRLVELVIRSRADKVRDILLIVVLVAATGVIGGAGADDGEILVLVGRLVAEAIAFVKVVRMRAVEPQAGPEGERRANEKERRDAGTGRPPAGLVGGTDATPVESTAPERPGCARARESGLSRSSSLCAPLVVGDPRAWKRYQKLTESRRRPGRRRRRGCQILYVRCEPEIKTGSQTKDLGLKRDHL